MRVSAIPEEMLRKAKASNTAYMQILQRYDSQPNNVVLVVEGKDDSTYYERVARDRCGDESRGFITIVAGNKSSVMKAYDRVNWKIYKRNRVLFFVDRDYSDFLANSVSAPEEDGANLYVTDGYSIENSLLNEHSAVGLARRSCSDNRFLDVGDEDEIRRLYRQAVAETAKVLVPIAACQIIWLRAGMHYNAERFQPDEYFSVREGEVEVSPRLDVEVCAIEKAFGMSNGGRTVTEQEREEVIKSIESSGGYECVVRGKYRMRMFCFWMRSLERRAFPSGARIRPGKVLNDVLAEAMAVAPAPKSLVGFIDRNLSPANP